MKEEEELPVQTSSCRIIVVWKDKILLHHRDNNPDIVYPDSWSLPGGGIEDNETPAEGVIRELREEASYSPKKVHYLGYRDNENGSRMHAFFIYVDDNEAGLFKKGKEGQGVGFFKLDELGSLNLPAKSSRHLMKYKRTLENIIKSGKIPSPQDLDLNH